MISPLNRALIEAETMFYSNAPRTQDVVLCYPGTEKQPGVLLRKRLVAVFQTFKDKPIEQLNLIDFKLISSNRVLEFDSHNIDMEAIIQFAKDHR